MTRLLLILLASCCISFMSFAQTTQELNWKKHAKLADELFSKRMYADAASHYEQAWRKQNKRKDFIYKAGESYYLIRNFKKAAEAYAHVKDLNSEFQYVGLKYARCLKQTGMYDAASREYVYFLNAHEGPDKAVLTEIVQTEIRGCEMGIRESENTKNQPLQVEHLSNNINSTDTEFAPVAFSDDILYFSSLMKGKAKIYRSQRKEGEWTKAIVPSGFKKLTDQHFGNGTFSPDLQRFYFTICDSDQVWGGLSSRCDIYVTKRQNSNWTSPEKLPEYINLDGTTNTQPHAVHDGNKEILYFSSNREGGMGGMDLWFVERDLTTDALDFTYPENLGASINTTSDEITPFYDRNFETLYFSSNGHISLGGFDIYKIQGKMLDWEEVQNVGIPINSPADDTYYYHLFAGTEGFFVSNRTFGMEKITTTQEDIFYFSQPINELMVRGNVFERRSQELVEEVDVALYELLDTGQKRLLSSKSFETGSFKFPLIANRRYNLEASKAGYTTGNINLSTYQEGKYNYTREIFIENAIDNSLASGNAIVSSNEGMIETSDSGLTSTTPSKRNPVVKDNRNYSSASSNSSGATVIRSDNPTVISSSSTPPRMSVPSEYNVPEKQTSTTISSPSSSSDERKYIAFDDYDYGTSTNTRTSTTNVNTEVTNEKYAYRTVDGLVTDAPIHYGTYYKIQLHAIEKYKPESSRYRPAKELGRLDTEYIVEKGLTRILLSDFFSEREAREMLSRVKTRGFERAYIVRYVDGIRQRRIR